MTPSERSRDFYWLFIFILVAFGLRTVVVLASRPNRSDLCDDLLASYPIKVGDYVSEIEQSEDKVLTFYGNPVQVTDVKCEVDGDKVIPRVYKEVVLSTSDEGKFILYKEHIERPFEKIDLHGFTWEQYNYLQSL